MNLGTLPPHSPYEARITDMKTVTCIVHGKKLTDFQPTKYDMQTERSQSRKLGHKYMFYIT